ncbi:hypothetical protein WMY93_034110 [Mugilogobius chulae]|uniref:Gamma-tubulin complex component n=1 Tax=Mugilogobius chulae TaxID=88201 RepID=A0AAW0MRJ2_9GOBI
MIHELLLALSGFPGTIFTWNKRNGLQVSQELPFLHPSELSVLNRQCKLGSDYIRFTEFIEQNTGHVHTQDLTQAGASLNGVYLRAFCTGLDSMLQPYRQALLDLEQEFLADPHLTISHVNYKLDQFQLLFPSVMVVVETIRAQKIHGCQILETVYKHSCGGLPPVRTALEKILCVCHGVLYKQLAAWMLHGLLLDQHEEFFIRQGPSVAGGSANQDEEEDDLFMYKTPDQPALSLCTKKLRPNLPVVYANKKLNMSDPTVPESMYKKLRPNLPESITRTQDPTLPVMYKKRTTPTCLSLCTMRRCVENLLTVIRACSLHLVQNVSEESQNEKGFLSSGSGELYQVFIDLAQHMLKTPPTAVTEHDVNVAFQQAAHKVLLDDDNLLPLLHLTVDYQSKDKDPGGRDQVPAQDSSPRDPPQTGWAALGLSYRVQWPLHILFTPAVLEKYNVVFRYLLSVRRVQSQLQHLWALQMQRKHLKSSQSDAPQWRLRNHMAFLIDNLQYYLQVDVLEAQFSQLLAQINSTRDFESIRLAHDHFISNLLAQSFILLKPVFHCLSEILELCHSFCSLVGQNSTLDDRGLAQLDLLTKGFRRQSSLLFKILSSVRNHQINSDLAQLLLRLDYNKYYTCSGGTLGSV